MIKLKPVKEENLTFNELSWYLKGLRESKKPNKKLIDRFFEMIKEAK